MARVSPGTSGGRCGRCRLSYVLDQSALYRLVGSPEIMAAQLRHLLGVAAMPNVVLQVMPEVAHDALAANYVLADDAVWSEHMVSGGVYTDPVIVSSVAACHDNLRGECLPGADGGHALRHRYLALLLQALRAPGAGPLPGLPYSAELTGRWNSRKDAGPRATGG